MNICDNMDETAEHFAKWKNPDREWYNLYVKYDDNNNKTSAE